MSNKNSTLFLVKEYLQYYLKSNNAHGLHSPFVFDLYNNVFKDKTPFYCFQKIEDARDSLKLNFNKIELEDYGAGSRKSKSQLKSISEIANTSLTKPKYAQLLFKLLNYSNDNQILELGTSLGITTAYLASVNASAHVYSFEGDKSIASVAQNTFKKLKIKNVNVVIGEFSKTLVPWLNSIDFKLDFVFFDGNHRYQSTIEYFELILPHLHDKSIVIVDDIRWSKGMQKAWEELKSRKEIGVSIDVFQMGVLYLKQNQEKEDFVIRY